MFVSIAVHRVKPGAEQLMIDSMHRYGAAAQAAGGIRQTFTLRDERSGALVGLAIWDSEEAYAAAGQALVEAVSGDDFASWHEGEWQIYHCTEV
jgi:heme-degrading monooxygenase HmoA